MTILKARRTNAKQDLSGFITITRSINECIDELNIPGSWEIRDKLDINTYRYCIQHDLEIKEVMTDEYGLVTFYPVEAVYAVFDKTLEDIS